MQFLTPFLASAVSVALPVIGREFHAGAVQLSIIQSIYILAVSAMILPIGRFADIHGRKKVFVSGTFLVMLATILITFAVNIEFFILFRFIQGMGAAMITSTSLAILTSVFPKEKRGKAMGIIVAVVYVGLATGPTLAGFLITQLGWRWVFYTIVPIEFVALFLSLIYLRTEWYGEKGAAFDLRGSIVYVLSLTCMMVGGSLAGKMDYGLALIFPGILGLCLFLNLQSKTVSPLIDTTLLRTNHAFTLNSLATLINYAASFGTIFLFSLHLQDVAGLTAQQAGFILIVQPVVQAFVAPTAGKLADKYPPAFIATLGMFFCTVGLAISATIDTETTLPAIIGIFVFMGVGFGLFSSPNMVAIMASVEQEFYGVASSIIATMRSLGMLVSIALITIIIGNVFGDQPITQANSPLFVSAMKTSFFLFTVLGIMGIIFSLGKENILNKLIRSRR